MTNTQTVSYAGAEVGMTFRTARAIAATMEASGADSTAPNGVRFSTTCSSARRGWSASVAAGCRKRVQLELGAAVLARPLPLLPLRADCQDAKAAVPLLEPPYLPT